MKKPKTEIKIVDGKKVKYVETKSGGLRKSRAKKKLGFIPKKVSQGHHHYEPEKYLAWKKAVLDRDNHTCIFPNCGEINDLEIHHIKPWSQNPSLRFEPLNGATLCQNHHKSLKGKEEQMASVLSGIIFRKLKQRLNDNNKNEDK
jgi:5-methylcytosine-specific restriction endonuclease McrA